jgi:hypothetical protein
MAVEIPPDLFDPEPASYAGGPENFLVITDEVDAAVLAMAQAGERMMCTDGFGVEHPDYDAANESEWAPPSYVSDPKVTPAGIHGYVDCNGGLEAGQSATFRKILKEEFAAAGVIDAKMRTFWYDASGKPLID